MNVIPKLLQGGGFESFFTEYKPIQVEAPRRSQLRESRSSSEDEKGKLTEKDLFNMIKDIDGLPNEMHALVTNLMNTFQMSSITGRDINSLATTYLQNLYQLKVALLNKARYDKALETALNNGSLLEPAIYRGHYVSQDENGNYKFISPELYFNNKDNYLLLTTSDIGYLRRNDPRFNNNDMAFDIINNSVGFESFQKHITAAKTALGSNTYTRNGYFSVEGQASKGLELLTTLSKEDYALTVGSVTAEGLYEYKIIDKNLLNLINSLLSYILNSIPENDKAWASWKMLNPDKEKATKDLIYKYLVSGLTSSHSFDINYKGTMEHAMGKGKSSGKEEDPKEGFWVQVQTGEGGTEGSYDLILDHGLMLLEGGKYYGATPGPDLNCSLGDYLSKSGLGHLRINKEGITFGDIELSSDSYDDVMVNTRSGAYAVTLPTKNGKVWLEAVEVYNNFKKELKQSGINQNTELYNLKVKELLKKPEYSGLAPLLLNNGELNPNNSSHFLVLEGITSSKAVGIKENKKQSIDDITSNFIVNAGDDEGIYRVLEEGLSSKDRGKYEVDRFLGYNPADWFGLYEKVYKGNIYIPLTTNLISGMNADKNDVKASTAKKYEEMLLEWTKDNIKGSSSTEMLWQ